MRGSGRRRLGRVYGIADLRLLGAARLVDAVEAMAEEGVETIQIRAKRTDDRALEALVGEAVRRLEGWQGTLWIDDRVDLARLHRMDGVHLGQRDLPVAAARAILGDETAIGMSTHSLNQIREADQDPAVDWIAFGPVYPTSSKEAPDAVVGLPALRKARKETAKPLIAIGGINSSNLEQVLEAGADAGALLSALCEGDVRTNCRHVLSVLADGR